MILALLFKISKYLFVVKKSEKIHYPAKDKRTKDVKTRPYKNRSEYFNSSVNMLHDADILCPG